MPFWQCYNDEELKSWTQINSEEVEKPNNNSNFEFAEL